MLAKLLTLLVFDPTLVNDELVDERWQTLQTQNAQRVMQELAPQAQEVLRSIIETDQIGLLLQQQAVIHADLGYNITAKVSDKMNQLGAE